MKHRKLYTLLVLLVATALIASGCSNFSAAPAAGVGIAEEEDLGNFTPKRISAPNCDYGGKIRSIEALDAYTVRFTLCSPDPAFLSKVAFGSFGIQEEIFLNLYQGVSAKMSEDPNGTGPYKLKEWVRGDHLTLEVNPNYWGVPPRSKTITFRWANDPVERLRLLTNNKASGIDNVSPGNYEVVNSNPKLALYPRPPMGVAYLGMNNTKPPFDNPEVRQAFAKAIDRRKIVEQYYPNGSRVADQFVPPSIKPGYTDNFRWYDYLPDLAKSELQAAGFDFNQEIVLPYRDVARSYMPRPDQVAKEIQAQLAKIGVKIRLEVRPDLLSTASAGEESLFLLGWGADYPDASNFYDFHFTGASKKFGTPYPELEAEIKTASSINDAAQRQSHYDTINQMVKDLVPVIPLAYGTSSLAFRADTQNIVIGPLNENFDEMSTPTDELVFVQSAEPLSLWCGDEIDGETLRICNLLYDPLLNFTYGGAEIRPGLAESWQTNSDLTEWTFTLRQGVKFSYSASLLDANDVVATYQALWDASSPNHKGNSGNFEYFAAFFGGFINKK